MTYHPKKSVLLDFTQGEDCTIHAPVWIGNKVKIGDRCKIQAFAFIPEGVTIGDDVFIGPHVCFTNDKYPPSTNWSETVVEDGVSIGANATILPGIRIGKGAMVGAGAVVSRNVEANTTVFGNPATKHYSYKCELCQKNFMTEDKRGARFCSRRCYNLAWSDPIKKQELGLVPQDYKITSKYKEYQANCEKRKIDFSLSFDQFKSFWQIPCFYCDEKMDGIGLDRVDNNIGYKIDNIVSCCWECNRLKGNLDQEVFFEQVKRIYQNVHAT